MARRRLGPPQPFSTFLPEEQAPGAAPSPSSPLPPGLAMPPIARIAGQAATEAALQGLAADVAAAREQGLLIEALPLAAIDAHHLTRDRLAVDDEELAALATSLRERGQQVPIEVVELGAGSGPARDGPRFGLISGWRRLTALRQLAEAEPARFTTVLAVRRRPENSAQAYRAMVEENELRVGLSYYERARIVARAAGQGVFPGPEAALAGLFGTASRSKRSKIGSFLRIHDALDGRLNFAAAIPERLGLQLSRALQDQVFAERLRERLRKAPAASAEAELAVLARALREAVARPEAKAPAKTPEPPAARSPAPFAAKPAGPAADDFPLGPRQEHDAVLAPGLRLRWRAGRVTLSGEQVDGPLVQVLVELLPEYLRDRL